MSSGGPTAPVVFQGETSLAPTSAGEVTDLLRYALEMGRDAETMERLVALHERITDRAAATEFTAALADFQHECPAIPKKKRVSYANAGGGTTSYSYAELPEIEKIVRPLLYARGLSFNWNTEVKDRLMTATCTLSHVSGHSKASSFSAPVESKAGMSEQQKYASARSYAKRLSLIDVLGLTTEDVVSDGFDMEPILPEEVDALKKLAKEVVANEATFLEWMNVSSFEEITRGNFKRAQRGLEQKRRKK